MEKAPGLQDFDLHKPKKTAADIDSMTNSELLELHSRIEKKLGGTTLEEVNLVRETLLQMHRAKALQELAQKSGADIPMNQRAQVQNSLSNMLAQLGRTQINLFTSERIKKIEGATIRVVKKMDEASQAMFFDLLEQEMAQLAAEELNPVIFDEVTPDV